MNDKIYNINEEECPTIQACLMHPHIPSLETFRIDQPQLDFFGGYSYGLCKDCIDMTKTSNYQDHIDLEIHMRLNKLKEKGE